MLIRRILNLALPRSITPATRRVSLPVSLPIKSCFRSFIQMSTEEKSITLPVLEDSELKDGEMKQVEFGEGESKGKVLLVKIGGKVVGRSTDVGAKRTGI
jgi:hypothetical protein